MKRIPLAFVIALLSTQAHAQTQFPANTLWGNTTASTGLPSVVPIPNCPTGALDYTPGAGFGCATGGGGGGTPGLLHGHIFVGSAGNIAADFGTLATFADAGTLTITPTPATTTSGLNIQQSGPVGVAATSTAGTNCTGGNSFIAYNYICVDSEGTQPTAGSGVLFATSLNVGLITGGNSTGDKYAANFFIFHSAASAATGNRDHIAINAGARSRAPMGGTDTGAGAAGTQFAAGYSAQLNSGATNYFENAAAEYDCGIQPGASSKHQLCAEVVNGGNVSAAVLDGGFVVGAVAGSPGFKHGFLFTSLNGGAPVGTAGTLIGTDTTNITVAHGVDLSGYTFSSDAFKSAGFSVSGTGAVSSAGLTLTSITGISVQCLQVNTSGAVSGSGASCGSGGGGGAVSSVNLPASNTTLLIPSPTGAVTVALNLANSNTWTAAQGIQPAGTPVAPDAPFTINANTVGNAAGSFVANLHILGADGQANRLLMDNFGGSNSIVSRTSGGTAAAKTAVASGAILFQIASPPYDGASYGGSSQIQVIAAENITATRNGSYVKVLTVPIGTAAGGVEMTRFQPSGGLSIGTANVATDGGNGIIVANGATLTATTNASSSATGALITAGGLGVAKEAYFGGNGHYGYLAGTGSGFWLADSSNAERFFYGADATLGDTFRVFSVKLGANIMNMVAGTTNNSSLLTIASAMNVQATNASTSPSTGAFTVNGGLGVNGAVWANTFFATPSFPVSSLPACTISNDGARSFVSNNTGAATFGGAVVTGGTTHIPVYCDGSVPAWKQG